MTKPKMNWVRVGNENAGRRADKGGHHIDSIVRDLELDQLGARDPVKLPGSKARFPCPVVGCPSVHISARNLARHADKVHRVLSAREQRRNAARTRGPIYTGTAPAIPEWGVEG